MAPVPRRLICLPGMVLPSVPTPRRECARLHSNWWQLLRKTRIRSGLTQTALGKAYWLRILVSLGTCSGCASRTKATSSASWRASRVAV